MLIWGVHVHVGVSSAHKVMPIISSLLNQYPAPARAVRVVALLGR